MKLVLLPGLDGTGTLYAEFAKHLSPEIELHCIAYPKHETLGYQELEAYVLQRLPHEEYFILAESFSGPIGIRLATQKLPFMSGLVLCCTFAQNPSVMPKAFAPLVKLVRPQLVPHWLMSYLLMGRWRTPALRDLLVHALSLVSGQVLAHRLSEILQVDVTQLLLKVKIPVLTVHASADLLISTSSKNLMAKMLSQGQAVEIEGPHFLLQSQPKACAEHVSQWMKQLESCV